VGFSSYVRRADGETKIYRRVVQPYCKHGPDNFSDCLRGPDVLNLLVLHIQDSSF